MKKLLLITAFVATASFLTLNVSYASSCGGCSGEKKEESTEKSKEKSKSKEETKTEKK